MSDDLEIKIHENQTTLDMFDYDIKMSLGEFSQRCMPGSAGQTAEFDLRAVNLAFKDGVKYSIKTINNEVYFKKMEI